MRTRTLSRVAAAGAMLALVVGACGGTAATAAPGTAAPGTAAPSAATSADPSAGTAEFGPAEKAALTVAIPFPDIVMYGRYWIAEAEGYLGEEGITIEVVTADDPVAAVISGSADIAVQSAGAAILAANEGLDAEIIASHSCRQAFAFAVQPEVKTAADLAGKDVVLAGTPGDPAEFEREKVLKEAGWDVRAAGVNLVYPGPGSDSWREFFLADRVALVPYYGDDRPFLVEDGASFPVTEIRAWPNDVYVTKTGWTDENPNAAGRFLRAVMKATAFHAAPGLGQPPANEARILEIYKANESDTSLVEANDSPYKFGPENYCDNLYYDQAAWDTTISGQELEVGIGFEEGTNLTSLLAAQASLGMDNHVPSDTPNWP
jgi:NitT/TauT family transport system substrate-binding protein